MTTQEPETKIAPSGMEAAALAPRGPVPGAKGHMEKPGTLAYAWERLHLQMDGVPPESLTATPELVWLILLDQERRIAELERRLSFKSEPLNEALLREARRVGVHGDE